MGGGQSLRREWIALMILTAPGMTTNMASVTLSGILARTVHNKLPDTKQDKQHASSRSGSKTCKIVYAEYGWFGIGNEMA